MFTCRQLIFRRGDRVILDRIDLSLDPERLHVLLGPNGAGKSTLLRVLTGELQPAAGSVRLDNTGLSVWSPRGLAARRAVVPQNPTLAFSFSVRETVELGRIPWAGTPRCLNDNRAVAAALRTVGITDLAERPYPHLSGGEAQRVHIARALAQIWDHPDDDPPPFLFLDEPTAHLDLAHQGTVLEVCRGLVRDRGFGACVVLHDVNLAMTHADRVLLLHHGRLAHDGRPTDVLTPDTLAAVYGIRAGWVRHPDNQRPHIAILPAAG
ncbi:MAG: heme ABC transporter ATP-binding protein [Opitutales bacterium]